MEDSPQPPAPPPLFLLGRTVVTPGARAALQRSGQSEHEFLDRHQRGDWGDVDKDGEGMLYDAEVTPEGRNQLTGHALSSFHTPLGEPLWAITVWDTGTTTVSLPLEVAAAPPDATSQM